MSTDTEQAPIQEQGEVLTDVASANAQFRTDLSGRVPMRVSHWAGPDASICIGLSRIEQAK